MKNLPLCALAGLLCVTAASRATAEVEFVGRGSIPGSATDLSGLQGTYTAADGTSIPANQLGSFGSAIMYTGQGRRYYAADDRGFGDGSTPSIDRVQVFDIDVDPTSKTVTPRLVETRLLTDESGRNFIGSATPGPLRLDPEGIAPGPDGSFYLSDEYGPFLYQFDAQGKRLKALPVPTKFLVAHPDADEEREINRNNFGRVPNKGMEGLTITPDGRTLVGIMQAPLIQDGGRDGINDRILTLEPASDVTHEYVYQLESKKMGVSEILAVDGHRFLVLERDSKGGKEGVARLFLIDLEGATDVRGIGTETENGLPARTLPMGFKPVAKRLFLNLHDPRYGLSTDEFPKKVEGLTWGPDLADGRRLLLITSDNDLKSDAPSLFYAFAVPRADLSD